MSVVPDVAFCATSSVSGLSRVTQRHGGSRLEARQSTDSTHANEYIGPQVYMEPHTRKVSLLLHGHEEKVMMIMMMMAMQRMRV